VAVSGPRRGPGQVWRSGSDFQRVFAVRLASGEDAAEFVTAELAVLRATPAANVFPLTDPAGATGVLLSGETRGDRRGVFCQQVLFNVVDVAFVVATCSPDRPGSVDAVVGLARSQAARATVAF
jgi:hypothetical protein